MRVADRLRGRSERRRNNRVRIAGSALATAQGLTGTIIEIRLWQVPPVVRGSRHRFKYSLFYRRNGLRIVGYDDEAGKGDHRHYLGHEEPYGFTSPEQLIADFLRDVRAARRS
jgi:hypothetical protein